MNRRETALDIFDRGFNCCQAVLDAYCDEFSLDRTTALKIAAGFGGGMRKGEVCGAVTGALMVLGLRYGHSIEGDVATKKNAYDIVAGFMEQFAQRHQGTVLCRTLLGYDISRKEEYERAAAAGVFTSVCPAMIGDAVEILETLL